MTVALTHSEAELQHVHGSFLLQEVHETKEEILLAPDLLQLQLQHLHVQRKMSSLQERFETTPKLNKEINTCKMIHRYTGCWMLLAWGTRSQKLQ